MSLSHAQLNARPDLRFQSSNNGLGGLGSSGGGFGGRAPRRSSARDKAWAAREVGAVEAASFDKLLDSAFVGQCYASGQDAVADQSGQASAESVSAPVAVDGAEPAAGPSAGDADSGGSQAKSAEFPLDALDHAALLDFQPEGVVFQSTIDRCREDLRSARVTSSSAHTLLEQQRAILESWLFAFSRNGPSAPGVKQLKVRDASGSGARAVRKAAKKEAKARRKSKSKQKTRAPRKSGWAVSPPSEAQSWFSSPHEGVVPERSESPLSPGTPQLLSGPLFTLEPDKQPTPEPAADEPVDPMAALGSLTLVVGDDIAVTPDAWAADDAAVQAFVSRIARADGTPLTNARTDTLAPFFDALVARASRDPSPVALSGMVALAMGRGSPQFMVPCVRFLLQGALQPADEPPLLSEDAAHTLDKVGLHEAEYDVSLPWSHAQYTNASSVANNDGGLFGRRDRGSRSMGAATDGRYVYIHSGRGIEVFGTGLHGTTTGQPCNMRSWYRTDERVHMACVRDRLYLVSPHLDDLHAEVLKTDSLQTEGSVYFGLHPEYASPMHSMRRIVSDGRYLYVLSVEEIVEKLPSSDDEDEDEDDEPDSNNDKSSNNNNDDDDDWPSGLKITPIISAEKTRTRQVLVVYGYDPTRPVTNLHVAEDPDDWHFEENFNPDTITDAQRTAAATRLELARTLYRDLHFRFSLAACILALRRSRNSMNLAVSWLLQHGDGFRARPKLPCVMRVVCGEVEPHVSTSDMDKASVYATGEQLVMIFPPDTGPWNGLGSHTARVFSLRSGRHVCDKVSDLYIGGRVSFYDRLNNRIWSVSNTNDPVTWAHCANFGPEPIDDEHDDTDDTPPPSASASTAEDDDDEAEIEPAPSADAVSSAISHRRVLRQLRQLSLEAGGTVTDDEAQLRPRNYAQAALFMLTHTLRILSHRDLVTYPLSRLLPLWRRKESGRIEYERLLDSAPERVAEFRTRIEDSLKERAADRVRRYQEQLVWLEQAKAEAAAKKAQAKSKGPPADEAEPEEAEPKSTKEALHSQLRKHLRRRKSQKERAQAEEEEIKIPGEDLSQPEPLESALTALLEGVDASIKNNPDLLAAWLHADSLVRAAENLRQATERLDAESSLEQVQTLSPASPAAPFLLDLEVASLDHISELIEFAHQKLFGDDGLHKFTGLLGGFVQDVAVPLPGDLLSLSLVGALRLLSLHLQELAYRRVDTPETLTELTALPAIARLREQLLSLVLDTPSQEWLYVSLARGLAISSLMTAFPIFFDTHERRFSMLIKLMDREDSILHGPSAAADTSGHRQLLSAVFGWFQHQRNLSTLLLSPSPLEGAGASRQSMAFLKRLVGLASHEATNRLDALVALHRLDGASPPKLDSSFQAVNPTVRLLHVLLLDLLCKSGVTEHVKPATKAPAVANSDDEDEAKQEDDDKPAREFTAEDHEETLCRLAELLLETSTVLVERVLALPAWAFEERDSALHVMFVLRGSILQLVAPMVVGLSTSDPASETPAARSRRLLLPLEQLLTGIDSLVRRVPELRAADILTARNLTREPLDEVVLESPHPYQPGDCIFSRSLHFSGATHISVTFDPRCSTSGRGDVVKLYADANFGAPLDGNVGPFSGPAYGGSWRTRAYVFPGNSMSIDFTAGQKPEPQDPNRWGFRCVVRGLSIRSRPWLCVLESTLASVAASIISTMIQGPPRAPEEKRLQRLLSSPALCSLLHKGLTASSRLPIHAPPGNTPSPRKQSLALSPTDTGLDAFLRGDRNACGPLLAFIKRHEARVVGTIVLQRRPQHERDMWAMAVRGLIASMLKHSGIAAEVVAVMGDESFFREDDDEAAETQLLGDSSALLRSRIKYVAREAQSFQAWMLSRAQAYKGWNVWCGDVIEDLEKRRALELAAKAAAKAASDAAAAAAAEEDDDDDEAKEAEAKEEEEDDEDAPQPSPVLVDEPVLVPPVSRKLGDYASGSEDESEPDSACPAQEDITDNDDDDDDDDDDSSMTGDSEPDDDGASFISDADAASINSDVEAEDTTPTADPLAALPDVREAFASEFADSAPQVKQLCSIARVFFDDKNHADCLYNVFSVLRDEARDRFEAALAEPQSDGDDDGEELIFSATARSQMPSPHQRVIDEVLSATGVLLKFNAAHSSPSLLGLSSAGKPSKSAEPTPKQQPKMDAAAFLAGIPARPPPMARAHSLVEPDDGPAADLLGMDPPALQRAVSLTEAETGKVPAHVGKGVADLRAWISSNKKWQQWDSSSATSAPPAGAASSGMFEWLRHHPLGAADSLGATNAADPSPSAGLASLSSPIQLVRRFVQENFRGSGVLTMSTIHEARARSREAGLTHLTSVLRSLQNEGARVHLLGLLAPALAELRDPRFEPVDEELEAGVASASTTATAGGNPERTVMREGWLGEPLFLGMECASIAMKRRTLSVFLNLSSELESLMLSSRPRSDSSAIASVVREWVEAEDQSSQAPSSPTADQNSAPKPKPRKRGKKYKKKGRSKRRAREERERRERSRKAAARKQAEAAAQEKQKKDGAPEKPFLFPSPPLSALLALSDLYGVVWPASMFRGHGRFISVALRLVHESDVDPFCFYHKAAKFAFRRAWVDAVHSGLCLMSMQASLGASAAHRLDDDDEDEAEQDQEDTFGKAVVDDSPMDVLETLIDGLSTAVSTLTEQDRLRLEFKQYRREYTEAKAAGVKLPRLGVVPTHKRRKHRPQPQPISGHVSSSFLQSSAQPEKPVSVRSDPDAARTRRRLRARSASLVARRKRLNNVYPRSRDLERIERLLALLSALLGAGVSTLPPESAASTARKGKGSALTSPALSSGASMPLRHRLALQLLRILVSSPQPWPRVMQLSLRLCRLTLPPIAPAVLDGMLAKAYHAQNAAGNMEPSPLPSFSALSETGSVSLASFLVNSIGHSMCRSQMPGCDQLLAETTDEESDESEVEEENEKEEPPKKDKADAAGDDNDDDDDDDEAKEEPTEDEYAIARRERAEAIQAERERLAAHEYALVAHWSEDFDEHRWNELVYTFPGLLKSMEPSDPEERAAMLQRRELSPVTTRLRLVAQEAAERGDELPGHRLGLLFRRMPPEVDPAQNASEEEQREAQTKFDTRCGYRSGDVTVNLDSWSGNVESWRDTDMPSVKFSSGRSFSTARAQVQVTGGRWYYEVGLLSDGLLQIGWAHPDHQPQCDVGVGVGDDARSWAYDGFRRLKWHDKKSQPYGEDRRRWKTGDVIGCALDLESSPNEMRFFVNGEDMGVAFTDFDIGDSGSGNGSGLRPAISISSRERARVIFNGDHFICGPPDGFYALENDRNFPKVHSTAEQLEQYRVISKAEELRTTVEQLGKGRAVLMRGSRTFCAEFGALIASSGLPITMMRNIDLPSVAQPKMSTANVDRSPRFRGFHGRVVQTLCAEYVDLLRVLLNSRISSEAHAESVRAALTSAFEQGALVVDELQEDSDQVASEQPRMHALLGALCTLGGFEETLRPGALVKVSIGDATHHRPLGVVVEYATRGTHAYVVLLGEGREVARRTAVEQLTPVAGLSVDVNSYPPSAQVFDLLTRLVRDDQASDSDSSPLVRAETREDVHAWLRSELQWRAVSVLESLISRTDRPTLRRLTSETQMLDASSSALYVRLGKLLLARAATCPPRLRLEEVAEEARQLRERLIDLRIGMDAYTSAAAFPQHHDDASARSRVVPRDPDFDGEAIVYGTSAFLDSTSQASGSGDVNRMLAYWERRIIPLVWNHVRRNFKWYEMLDFFAQMRRPLHRQEDAESINAIFIMCDNRLPHAVSFPPADFDFDTLMVEEAVPGDVVYVLPSFRDEHHELFVEHSGMREVVGSYGRIMATQQRKPQMVLVEFQHEPSSDVRRFWFPPHAVLKVGAASGADSIFFSSECARRLERQQVSLSQLIARRAVLSLCTHESAFLTALFEQDAESRSTREEGLDAVMDCILLALKESLELSSFSQLGAPRRDSSSYQENVAALEDNLAEFLSSCGMEPSAVCAHLLGRLRQLMGGAAAFVVENTSSHNLSQRPGASQDNNGVVSPFNFAGKLNNQGHRWRAEADTVARGAKCMRVPGASSLLLMFGKDAMVPAKSTIAVFADAACTKRVSSMSSGATSLTELAPLEVPSDECFVVVNSADMVKLHGHIVPLHPDLGLAVWLVGFLLKHGAAWAESPLRLVEDLTETVLSSFDLAKMMPSPLKQAVLRLVSRLLSRMVELRGNSSPTCLARLKNLHDEMAGLYADEVVAGGIFSSFLQQLVDVMVVSDNHRPPHDRICREFKFLSASETAKAEANGGAEAEKEEEPEEEPQWSCAVCTFLNPMSMSTCSICGSPKPPDRPKPQAGGGDNAGDSSQMFHDMMAMVSTLRYLTRETGGEERLDQPSLERDLSEWSALLKQNPAVRELWNAAYDDVRESQVESRLVLVDNLPHGPADDLRRAVSNALVAVDPALRIQPDGVALCVDPERQLYTVPSNVKVHSSWMRVGDDPVKLPLDKSRPLENGVFSYLGTRGGSKSFENPCSALNLVDVETPSSCGRDAPHTLLDLTPGARASRVVVEGSNSVSVTFTLRNHQLFPTGYALQHHADGGGYVHRWKLEATTTSGNKWTVLSHHKQGGGLSQEPGFTHAWSLDKSMTRERPFSRFRVVMFGRNTDKEKRLRLGRFELFGRLQLRSELDESSETEAARLEAERKALASAKTNLFAVLDLHCNSPKQRKEFFENATTLTIENDAFTPRVATVHVRPVNEAMLKLQKRASMMLEVLRSRVLPRTRVPDPIVEPSPGSKPKAKKSGGGKSGMTLFTSRAARQRQRKREKRRRKKQRRRERRMQEASAEQVHLEVERTSTSRQVSVDSEVSQASEVTLASETSESTLVSEAGTANTENTEESVPDPLAVLAPEVISALSEVFARHGQASETSPAEASIAEGAKEAPEHGQTDEAGAEKPKKIELPNLVVRDAAALKQLLAYHKPFELFCPLEEVESAADDGDSVQPMAAFTVASPDMALADVPGLAESLGSAPVTLEAFVKCVVETFGLTAETEPASPYLPALFSWLRGAGYDMNVQHHVRDSREQALAEQGPSTWTAEADAHLMRYLKSMASKVGASNLLTVCPTQLALNADLLATFVELERRQVQLPAIRLRFMFLRRFNALVNELLPLIDLRSDDPDSIAGLIRSGRHFIFSGLKREYLGKVLDFTAMPGNPPKVSVRRMQLEFKKSRNAKIDFARDTTFAHALEALMDVDATQLRPERPSGAEPFMAFELSFEGEHVVGEGGPYRQFFTDVAKELQGESKCECPLLCPVPNALEQVGEHRDRFTIRPSSAGSGQGIRMFEFLGMLFGCCIRTGVKMPLNLAQWVWKPLVQQSLELDDLDAMDRATLNSLRFLRSCTAEQFATVERAFTTRLSDRTLVELVPGGANVPVTYETRLQYVQHVLRARFNEHEQQVAAIRRGIGRIVPVQLLNLLDWTELEVLVCGEPNVDVDLLERHTKYSGVAPGDKHVAYLWKTLRKFDQTQRRKFIRFAWAQERLPLDDDEFRRSHVRMLVKGARYRNPDKALPRADTCFFNLELPAYSSEEVMRKQLLFAINTAVTMNRDNL